MLIGAMILLLGMVLGVFIGINITGKTKAVITTVTDKIIRNQKGIVVDLTPPVELGELPHEETN